MEIQTKTCEICGREYHRRLTACPSCRTRAQSGTSETVHSAATAPSSEETTRRVSANATSSSVSAASEGSDARKVIIWLWVLGLVVGVLGGIITFAALPELGEPTGAFGAAEDDGSVFGYIVGVLMISIGSVLLFIGATATAVMLGVRAARP